MSKAIEIAEERFARGEISKEEFEAIKAQLTPSAVGAVPSAATSKSSPAENVTISKSGAALWFVLGVFVMLAPAFLNLNDLGWRVAGAVAFVFFAIALVKNFFGK